MNSYKSYGTICVKGPCNLIYAICDIEYILNDNETFKYVFKPNYSVIELLNNNVFQGIPGINIDLKKEEYIRENIIPTFISERVPSESREDYYDLLSKNNMEYMDHILYLIRTKEQYSGDKLFVTEKHNHEIIKINNDHINSINYLRNIMSNICLGNNILIENNEINDKNRKIFHDIFLNLYSKEIENRKELQSDGIEKAKSLNKYKGRKPIFVDELLFLELEEKVNKKEITAKAAAEKLGISIDKYYRFKKKLQK